VLREFQAQGWSVELTHTKGPGHAVELAQRAANHGASHIVAVGGDGTVHDVVNGMLGQGSGAALAVVPVGTGNDFAKLLGLSGLDPVRAVRRLAAGSIRRFDVGRGLDEYFVNSMGFGFGAEVVRVRNAMRRLPGPLSYLVPVLKAFAAFEPPLYELTSEDRHMRGRIMMVELCNGTTAGGSYRFAPEASPSDGFLDVCVVRALSGPRFLAAVPRVMRGTHRDMPEVTLFQSRELTVRALEGPLVLHLDGELRTPGVTECRILLEPGRLNVLVAA
jgi:YegS/Rv2252/BmrU family lipid kinase